MSPEEIAARVRMLESFLATARALAFSEDPFVRIAAAEEEMNLQSRIAILK